MKIDAAMRLGGDAWEELLDLFEELRDSGMEASQP
jgi:hypothetical protein